MNYYTDIVIKKYGFGKNKYMYGNKCSPKIDPYKQYSNDFDKDVKIIQLGKDFSSRIMYWNIKAKTIEETFVTLEKTYTYILDSTQCTNYKRKKFMSRLKKTFLLFEDKAPTRKKYL